MATPPYCPSCFVKLEPHMLACPNCPMSFPEDDGPAAGSSNPLKQSRYYQFALPVLFFAALGMTIWWLASGLFRLGEENANAPGLKLSNARPLVQGEGALSRSTETSSYPPSTEKAPAYEGAGTVSIAPVEDEAPSGTVSVAVPEPAHRKRAKVVKEWKLRGHVYDLATMKPLAGCELVFTDGETRIRTRSNSEGNYRVIVPSLPDRGYTVTAAKGGYSPNYLDPGTEGVREMDASRRQQLAKELGATLSATPATIQGVGAEPLITDFYLAKRL